MSSAWPGEIAKRGRPAVDGLERDIGWEGHSEPGLLMGSNRRREARREAFYPFSSIGGKEDCAINIFPQFRCPDSGVIHEKTVDQAHRRGDCLRCPVLSGQPRFRPGRLRSEPSSQRMGLLRMGRSKSKLVLEKNRPPGGARSRRNIALLSVVRLAPVHPSGDRRPDPRGRAQAIACSGIKAVFSLARS